jgi:hypothetical protein
VSFGESSMLMTDEPQHADGPHKCSLPSRFVHGKPGRDSACSKIPFSNTAVSTTRYEPVVGPVIVIVIIGTIVRFWGSFGSRGIVWRNWGGPGDAQNAGLYFSELAEMGKAIVLDRHELNRTVFASERKNRRFWVH